MSKKFKVFSPTPSYEPSPGSPKKFPRKGSLRERIALAMVHQDVDKILEAMRNPTEEMITAAGKVFIPDWGKNNNKYRVRRRAYWRAMIDEARRK